MTSRTLHPADTAEDNQCIDLDSPDRRTILRAFAVAAAVAPFAPTALAAPHLAQAEPEPAPQQTSHADAIPNMTGSEQIAMLLYPGFTTLDFVGPHFFLSGLMGAKVHIVTNQGTLAPVQSDTALAVVPTARLDDLPAKLDVIFVPGGSAGTLAAMEHKPTLAFLRAHADTTRFKTSVCTGSFVLAAAKLLVGKRATSHWVARDTLKVFGATPVDERVVHDGDVITGAGISAGLDLGIAVVAALRGQPYAQAQMLQAEYAPAPPFIGGRPENTDASITAAMRSMLGGFNTGAAAVAKRI